VLLADAGYWHQQQMEPVVDRGIQVLIPPDAKSRKGTRPGWDGGPYAFMRRVLASDRGGELYGQRQAIIEPFFQHEVQPRHRPLQTARPSRRPHGMATDYGHSQPAEAPQTRARSRLRRSGAPAALAPPET
jgi:hypothetical protein